MKNILLIILAFALSACGSRTRTADRHRSVADSSTSCDSSGTSKTNSIENNLVQTLSAMQADDQCIEAEVSDGNTVSVKKFGRDGKLVSETLISGSGKAKLSESTKKSRKIRSQSSVNKVGSVVTADVRKKAIAHSLTDDRHTDVKRTEFSFIAYLWWIIIAGIILVLAYLQYKFNWIGLIKKHVLNVL